MGVAIGDEEANDNVDEKGELTSDVEEEEVLWEASEESKLEGCEEGRVHCPYQYEMFPYRVPPAPIEIQTAGDSFVFLFYSHHNNKKSKGPKLSQLKRMRFNLSQI